LWGLYRNNPSIGIYIYCTFMSMVVYDDVVLVRWLWNNVQRKARLANSRADKTTKNK